ncbi:hypothetical protein H257_00505 [Aphanomyces astaci]|uniref:2Fe-2S ferredoxin-type domain-containing protein n=2 Tax=Aphanomyces astaci TaxID=112090 RepID=W4HB31_APHAT|nr:hypothetical protein H257_00505 [Aphanomyces astaci]ETV89132.1 hypothetical protein H257_00505 [Aphanomyces astaci]RHY01592.1 hypothetical protein DYB36_003128 [Aphanomyces astaci]RHY66226.1 hypothetical protein DYB38_007218 [Aphanomyces astaci]|eukprot:XP_009821532.1 hypothetical protein H257_00505 [Aphanomyces astaci]
MMRATVRSVLPSALRSAARPSMAKAAWTASRHQPVSLHNALCFTSRSFSDKIHVTFVEADGTKKDVSAVVGETFLEIAHNNDIELEGACGGELACSTCHCVFDPAVYATLPPITEEEEDMLDMAWGLTDTSRLGCQIKATPEMDGITVTIPDGSNNML